MIDNKVKENIKKLSKETDNECCGFILSNNNVVPCLNVSPVPQKYFSISPSDYLRAVKIGKIEFVYHSHNKNPDFSEYDKLNLYNQKLRGILYCKEADSFKIFVPESYKNPYIGKKFEIGTSDCLSLVIEYYKNELKIELPNIERGEGWYTKNSDIISHNIPPFLKKTEEFKKHNIVVFDMLGNGKPCHFGIYLENDLILHHPRHRLSTIEIMSETLKKRIAYMLQCN